MLQYLTHRDLDGVDYIAEVAERLDGGGLAGAEPGEVGHPLAVIPWGAEHAAGDAAALQPELQVVLPGEADPAEDLKRGGRDLPARVGDRAPAIAAAIGSDSGSASAVQAA